LKESKHFKVLVAFQAWTDEQNPKWKEITEDGHYSLIIGVSEENIFLMDPSTLGRYTFIPKQEFLDRLLSFKKFEIKYYRWHDYDGRDASKVFNHLGVVIYKPNAPYDPNEVIRLE
jgi:hypothetical protein